MAMKMGLGVVLVRKPGKLPYATHSHTYDLEYAQDTLHIHTDALQSGDQVCIVDDVLATGGTAEATEKLCAKTGAVVTGFTFLLEIGSLKGHGRLRARHSSLILL
jgi:adenine phosphoribosyltransferase